MNITAKYPTTNSRHTRKKYMENLGIAIGALFLRVFLPVACLILLNILGLDIRRGFP